ncbi:MULTISPECIES: hypothetical protein [unclassified Shewanella]|nr:MULTISPECIES: hypothetical protein [unclassified Shewanella]MCG9720821.1 hypothetical protein [Shewanella sp. Isolate7]
MKLRLPDVESSSPITEMLAHPEKIPTSVTVQPLANRPLHREPFSFHPHV